MKTDMSRHLEDDEDELVRCDGCGREFASFELEKTGKRRYCSKCMDELEQLAEKREEQHSKRSIRE